MPIGQRLMTTRVDTVNDGCHDGYVNKPDATNHEATLERLREVRAQAIEHTRIARQFSAERRQIMQSLVQVGFSQSDLARELGVSRQAIQKMLAS
ncbi:helix-turn-helix transcriptional regulator [Leekyejoonella antrihumi]|uniref:Helix-turn-helix transcriptional regulator n=1 Tax=Leekyejoonella antrihumi TaxID=1660198 RepID=A0A563DR20_9MICO|nr:helix-turn-helix transcriptional regulator [Leekyejoonella antrihumi]